MNDVDIKVLLEKLITNRFRSGFRLSGKDRLLAKTKERKTIEKHAIDFVGTRLASKNPINDGKQTPFNGHPVFVAQHATATCCRSCLEKWHGIEKGREIALGEQEFIVRLIMAWIHRDLARAEPDESKKSVLEVQKHLFELEDHR